MSSTKSYVQLKEKYDRVVVLIDMDCFYCQVEEFQDPVRLSGKPIAVVQYLENAGIIAVNYAARALGVTRHMREKEAKAFCKELICVKVPSKNGKADLSKYRDAGYQVAKVLQTFTPLLERASIDEAYLDITENVVKKMQELRNNTFQLQPADFVNTFAVGYENIGLFVQDVTSSVDKNYDHVPEDERKAYASSKLRLLIGSSIVNEIRRAVKEQTKYECSAGIGHNKILAKLTCGFNKPNKQTILPIESISSLFNDLEVKKVKSLGGKLGEEVCSKLNAKTMSDILKYSESELQQHFQARVGSWLYFMARGIDLEKVTPKFMSKSIAVSKNFRGKNEITSMHTLKFWLKELAKEVVERLEKDEADCNRTARHMTVSFTQGEPRVDGKNVSSSRTVPLNGNSLNSFSAEQIADETFETIKRNSSKFLKAEGSVLMTLSVKHLGITAGKFEDHGSSKNLQDLLKNHQKRDTKKSPKVQKIETSPQGETSSLSRSAAISTIKKFERKSPRVMEKAPKTSKSIAIETIEERPEELLKTAASFAGENSIKGIKTLKHWITQNLLELCRDLTIDSEINQRAPAAIIVKLKQQGNKESSFNFPLEAVTGDLIDPEIFVESLKRSEGFVDSSDVIQNPIVFLEILPSSFENGKQWNYSIKCENAVVPMIEEEETLQDSVLEAELEEQEVAEPEVAELEEREVVELEELEVAKLEEPEVTEIEEQEVELDSDDDFQEHVRNKQRQIEEQTESETEESLEVPKVDQKPISPVYDASTDDEDIFKDLESEKIPEKQAEIEEPKEIEPKAAVIRVKVISGFNASSSGTSRSKFDPKDSSGPSSEAPGSSYMQTYAEFQAPLVPIELLNPKEACAECGKLIGILDMVAHLDHHLAFQIANQQREEYRQQHKTTATSSKKVVKPKVHQSKTPVNLIQRYVVKREEQAVAVVDDEVIEKIQCEQCQKFISNDEYISHLDYHFAQRLREDEMKKAASTAPKEVRRSTGKRPASSQKNLPKMKSMKAYFTNNN